MSKAQVMLLASSLMLSGLIASPVHAHIKMLKPAPWLNEGDGLFGVGAGDPQKGGPCGPGGYDDIQPIPLSNKITEFRAGETITVEWTETIPHPGWFRIALAENRADLKDPQVQIDASCNVMPRSSIPMGAHGNVLADGLFLKSSYDVLKDPYTYEVTLPNKPCEKCTLQLIQFMEQHAPGCIYYHCADIKILPANSATDAGTGDAGSVGGQDAGATGGAVDAGGQTGGIAGTAGGSASGTAGGSGATVGGAMPGVAGSSGGAAGTAAGGGASGGTASGTAGGTTGAATTGGAAVGGIGGAIAGMSPAEGAASDDDGGCECSVSEASPRVGNLLGMVSIALGLLARRRYLRRR
jgi:MYXO-CTERM domain-containing protein